MLSTQLNVSSKKLLLEYAIQIIFNTIIINPIFMGKKLLLKKFN